MLVVAGNFGSGACHFTAGLYSIVCSCWDSIVSVFLLIGFSVIKLQVIREVGMYSSGIMILCFFFFLFLFLAFVFGKACLALWHALLNLLASNCGSCMLKWAWDFRIMFGVNGSS